MFAIPLTVYLESLLILNTYKYKYKSRYEHSRIVGVYAYI